MKDPRKALSHVNAVEKAIDELSLKDLLDLDFAATNIAGDTGVDPDWLLKEATKRTLDGRRKWPTENEISFVLFLQGTMKSIKHEAYTKQIDAVACFQEEQPSHSPSPESELVKAENEKRAKKIVEELFDHFENDEQVTAILLGKADGITPAEIRRQGEMNKSQYDTAIKRLYRYKNQHFPRGGKND